jgi:bifunctional DNA-binding transcriptional regulator/antitoxin component of YhaV-PrlF toxin-antitoxin module
MQEPRLWPKKISDGGQISIPVELMKELQVSVGDQIYLVIYRAEVLILPGRDVEEAIAERIDRRRSRGSRPRSDTGAPSGTESRKNLRRRR